MVHESGITSRWLLVVLGVLWLGAGTWYEFLRDDEEFELRAQLHEERFQQRVNDCRGSFSERYECKTAADRENQMATSTKLPSGRFTSEISR